MSWNLGDNLDGLADVMSADAPALIYGDQVVNWPSFDRRSNNLAAWLIASGARPGDKLAVYLRNQPAYMETLAACFKARLVPVNVNFRYRDDELCYIFDDSDARFVVFAGEFAETLGRLRERLSKVERYLQVEDGAEPVEFAEAYESVVSTGEGARLDIARSPDDLFFLYTGGTTGLPKGVMWRQEDVWWALKSATGAGLALDPPADLDEHLERIRRDGPRGRVMPACPLMHGTALFAAIGFIMGGGCIVTLSSHHFDAAELWSCVEKNQVNAVSIVGDAFARPMLSALDENPGGYDLSSLVAIVSSGVIWSLEVKQGLLGHHPELVLIDSFGASEAIGFGSSIMTAQGDVGTARFALGPNVKVFNERDQEVRPGSGEPGFVARSGPIPLGYYKDEEKTARVFKTIEGVRYSIPGDWCTVSEDGTLNLLGRGSGCINSGGEKVYPEEVEEVLKTHPVVEDALVVGVPDARWGEAVTGVVQLRGGAELNEGALRSHVRQRLAGYKVPKRVLEIADLGRVVSGKADYSRVTEYARQQLGID
jgi:fatty-acyl-CoA synthase